MIIKFNEMAKVTMTISSLLFGTSFLDYIILARTRIKVVVKGIDKTEWLIMYLARLMIAALTMLITTIISLFISGRLMEIITATLGLISIVLMLNIGRLPIWEEEK